MDRAVDPPDRYEQIVPLLTPAPGQAGLVHRATVPLALKPVRQAQRGVEWPDRTHLELWRQASTL